MEPTPGAQASHSIPKGGSGEQCAQPEAYYTVPYQRTLHKNFINIM